MKPFLFNVGDRVVDKRDKQAVVGFVQKQRRHTNGSPKYVILWPEGRFTQWEVDLLPAPAEEAVNQ